jgi:HAD superfamily hydrolase (TIGR01509 family)
MSRYNPAAMKPQSFDLAIFDCDGVLVRKHGFDIDEPAYLRKFSGITLPDRIQTTATELKWNPPSNFHHVFNKRLAILTRKKLQPVPGIHDLLKSLPVPVCVASNGSREEIDLRLELSGLTAVFGDAIFSGMEVANPKPAPDVYLAAASSFAIPPARCLVVEDSIPGATAAVRAGMQVYGHAAFTPAEQLKEAGAVSFNNMAELKEMLAQEFNISHENH